LADCRISFKYRHAFIGKHVKQINGTDKQVGNTNEKKIVIIGNPAGIPGDNKDSACDNNGKSSTMLWNRR